MHFSGIIVGAAVFFSIGICHPAVIEMEYYLGKKSWWIWQTFIIREEDIPNL